MQKSNEWESETITIANKRSLARDIDALIVRAVFGNKTWEANVAVEVQTRGRHSDPFSAGAEFSNEFPLELYNDGTAIVDGGTIVALWDDDDLEIRIDIRNLQPQGDFMSGRVEVIIPEDAYKPNGIRTLRDALRLPDGGVRFEEMVMFSGGDEWESETITMQINGH